MTTAGFHVRLARQGEAWTIRCGGELDGGAAWHLSDAVEMCLDSKPSEITIDCNDVTFVDSGGLHSLLRASQETHERGVEYRIVLSPQVQDVLSRAGLLERLLMRSATAAR